MATSLTEVWSGVQVHVESLRGSAKAFTEISNANPGVVDSDAHGFTNGDFVLLQVPGFDPLDFCVARVAGVTTDSYELEGIDTTDFGDIPAGSAQKITFGVAASTFTDVNPSGGEAQNTTIATIHSLRDYDEPVGTTSLNYSFGSLWKPEDPALQALNGYFKTLSNCCIRITFKSGRKVLFSGKPSVSLAPGGSARAAVTTPVGFAVRGPLTTYAS